MPVEGAVKSNYAPKEMGSNKQRIRWRRNPSPCSHYAVEKGLFLWYNNSENCCKSFQNCEGEIYV